MAIIYTAIFNIIDMFQTEPILYLQSFASDSLTFIMMAITQMGYEQFIIGIICFIIFGISFRKGFLLLQLMMWQGLINGFLKELFGMPLNNSSRKAIFVPNKYPLILASPIRVMANIKGNKSRKKRNIIF